MDDEATHVIVEATMAARRPPLFEHVGFGLISFLAGAFPRAVVITLDRDGRGDLRLTLNDRSALRVDLHAD
jgi:hypothetical protein